jgi:protein ImuB
VAALSPAGPPPRIGCLFQAGPVPAEAHAALLEVALAHSPRVEDGGPGCVYLDTRGLAGLFGDDAALAERLRREAAARGLAVQVGIAGSRIAALVAARRGAGLAVIAPGDDAAWLASAPLALLPCDPATAERLRRWGLRRFGELAALPPRDLFERLGGEGLRLQALARGEDPRPLQACRPAAPLEARRDLDWAETAREPLVAAFAGLAATVCAGLERAALAADAFDWSCRLQDGREHPGRFVPPYPTREAGPLLVLIRAWLEAEPPAVPVVGLALRAQPVRAPAGQPALLGPARPPARALTESLARVIALVGPARVGVPVLLDSHRPDAVGMAPLVPPREPRPDGGRPDGPAAALALRRFRPPRPAAVRLVAGRPVALRAAGLAGPVVASAGPWRSSGDWWQEPRWVRDEWDVALADGTCCRLATDGSAWSLDGVYD